MGTFSIRALLSVLCLTLVAVLFTGCGLLGGADALEPPGGFDQLISLPLPGGMRVTVYRGAASPEEAMSIFTNIALQGGWHLREVEDDVRSMDVQGFFLSVVPVEKGDRMQLMAFTGAADAAMVVSVIGPADRIAEYYDSVPAGNLHVAIPLPPVSADDDELPGDPETDDEDEISDGRWPEQWVGFRGILHLIETFSSFSYWEYGAIGGGATVEYRYEGIAELEAGLTPRLEAGPGAFHHVISITTFDELEDPMVYDFFLRQEPLWQTMGRDAPRDLFEEWHAEAVQFRRDGNCIWNVMQASSSIYLESSWRADMETRLESLWSGMRGLHVAGSDFYPRSVFMTTSDDGPVETVEDVTETKVFGSETLEVRRVTIKRRDSDRFTTVEWADLGAFYLKTAEWMGLGEDAALEIYRLVEVRRSASR